VSEKEQGRDGAPAVMRTLRFGLCYDLKADYLAAGFSPEMAAEFDCIETVEGIETALAALGLKPVRIGSVRSLVARLAAGERWDGVFNQCEGVRGVAREAQVPAILEAFDIPYVFSDPLTLALALDKAMAKRVVRACGVPTAEFAVIETADDIGAVALPFPVFLKPVAEGSGKGVDAKSKADDAPALRAVATDLLARFRQPVLVETFLSGREFTVGITGTGEVAEVLGVAEIVQLGHFVGAGYGLANKLDGWEDKVAIAKADDPAAQDAAAVALSAWRALRCRDGGRVDIRCDGAGRANFIEVNPLAGIRPDFSDLCLIAKDAGLTYNALIAKIMASFFVRHPELARR
jgi:D-alanine-D-alanine ligase